MARKLGGIRFGIGEWYGQSLLALTPARRREFALYSLLPKRDRPPQPCPFQGRTDAAICTKDGGVCSLRAYSFGTEPSSGRALGIALEGASGRLRATCPYRFHEQLRIVEWIGETLLETSSPRLIGEVGFLESSPTADSGGGDDVGRIDMILVDALKPPDYPLQWCAVEIQAVYFSGAAMMGDFKAYADSNVSWPIYPVGNRRPDYRSSAPKRLMPQLQIKVPTLRRWGKKMAVVVDEAFFASLGQMDTCEEASNADIAWFVVRFSEADGQAMAKLEPAYVRYSTLERSVEALTGGKPVSLEQFQTRIRSKL